MAGLTTRGGDVHMQFVAGQSGQLGLPNKLANLAGIHCITRLCQHLHLQLCSNMGNIFSAESPDRPTLLCLPDDLFVAVASHLSDRDVFNLELANTRLYHVLLQHSCAWPYERRLDLMHFKRGLYTPETFRLCLRLLTE